MASTHPAFGVRLGCVGAAVAFHLGVLAWVAGPSPSPPQRRETLISVIDSPRPPSPPAAVAVGLNTETALPTAPGSAPPSARARRQKLLLPRSDPAPPPPSSPSPERAAISEPAPATAAHFYTFTEVDVPASPVADWELDAATLDAARLPRIVFDLFVSDDGSVIDCTIVEPADLDTALRAALEARLRTTALLPAIRTGQPVDSVRRIELFVS